MVVIFQAVNYYSILLHKLQYFSCIKHILKDNSYHSLKPKLYSIHTYMRNSYIYQIVFIICL